MSAKNTPNSLILLALLSALTLSGCNHEEKPYSRATTDEENRALAIDSTYQKYKSQIATYKKNFFDCQFHTMQSLECEKRYQELKEEQNLVHAVNENYLAYHIARIDSQRGQPSCDLDSIKTRALSLLNQYALLGRPATKEQVETYINNADSLFSASVALYSPLLILQADLLQDHLGPDGTVGSGLDKNMVADFSDYIDRIFLLAYGKENIIQANGNQLVLAAGTYLQIENGLRGYGIAVDKASLLIHRNNSLVVDVKVVDSQQEAEKLYRSGQLIPGVQYILAHRSR